jgi:uncharacterized membrane protein YfcA
MHLVELVLAGLVLGFLNTVSSGGSVISLPLLVSIGYPAAVANATNRVPVAIGLLIAIWQFHRAGSIPWSYCLRLVPLILFGTFLGVQISLLIPRSSLTAAINFAVVIALILLLIKPKRWLDNESAPVGVLRFSPQLLILLFLVSIWNGFIVLDAGTYLLLTLTLVGGMSLSQANVMKVVLMGVSGLFSLILFTGYDTVNWSAAFPLALGSVAGSMIGSRLVLGGRAKQWIYWSLVSAISIGLLFKVVEYLL